MIKVQFIHGLESGPLGAKVQHLRRAGFVVLAPDMQMSVRRLDRENSVVRNLLRLPEPRLAVAMGALGAGLLWSRGAGLVPEESAMKTRRMLPWAMLAGAGVLAGARHKAWARQALSRSFERCVALQARQIEAHDPDILVGSSWGGAVTMELVRRGIWRGKPVILLAPAYRRVGERIGWADLDVREEELRLIAARQPISLIHDPLDDTVPHEDSVRFVRGSTIDFASVDGGGHRLLEYLERGQLDELIRAHFKALSL